MASKPSRNLPNEPGAWDADFSYGYLERLYERLARDFTPALLGDAGAPAPDDKRRVFVRHDVDVSLAHAAALAGAEARWGLRSTYHVMLDSPFYDVRSADSRAALERITGHGHEIGLHYDVVARKTRGAAAAELERDVGRAAAELEAILGRPARSLSFHLLVPELVNGPLLVAGRVSAYGRELFKWYVSDSRARWREGEPLASLDRPRAESLQILIHPIWWGPTHVHPAERLRTYLLELASRLGTSYDELRDRMWDHIIYDAADA